LAVWIPVVLLIGLTLRSRTNSSRSEVVGSDADAVADLGARLLRDWSDEAVRREVTKPAPVLVSWSSTGRPAASRSAVFGDPVGGSWHDIPLRGQTDELNEQIVATFRNLPSLQLMVLGAPGAGKSVFAMLLTLGLIRSRAAGEPVPVLFTINEWDPAEAVATFVGRRLAEDYAELLDRYGNARVVANRLVEHQRILPVLDGFDELPDGETARALDALNAYAAAGRPLVVTSRTRQYEQAVQGGRTFLMRTAVVELQPVDVSDAITYLSFPEAAKPRWEPVFAHLRGERGRVDPLAQALATPLMVSLARIAYQRPGTDPAELLSLPSKGAVGDRLMNAFIAAVYDGPAGQRLDAVGRRLRTYPPAKSRRWLSCLAYHLYVTRTRDLRWWQIKPGLFATDRESAEAQTATWAVMIGGLLAGVTGALAQAGFVLPALSGCLVTLVATLGWFRRLWTCEYPRTARVVSRASRRGTRILQGIAAGMGCAALTCLDAHAQPVLLLAGIAYSLIVVAVPWWRPRPPRHRGSGADPELVHHRHGFLAMAAQNAVAGGLTVAITSELTGVASPWTAGAFAAAICGSAAGLVGGGWAWARFRLTHLRLVAAGRLPLRLEAFLRDAHLRGVFRKDGAVYQFRHVHLQDYLARTSRAYHLCRKADDDDWNAALALADLIVENGTLDPEIATLRLHDRKSHEYAIGQATIAYAGRIRVSAAIDALRSQADTGDVLAAARLADLLAENGRVDELRLRADAGDHHAVRRLVEQLVVQGAADELIARKNAGDDYAGRGLVDLLAAQGRVDELKAHADAGDHDAAVYLAHLGYADDSIVGLGLRCDAGDGDAALLLARLLAERGQHAEAMGILLPRVEAGDGFAARQLDELLNDLKRFDDLRARSSAGDWYAGLLLVDQELQELRYAAADREIAKLQADPATGDSPALLRLADLLTGQGRIEEAYELLRPRAHAAERDIALRAAQQLVRLGRVDDAIALLRPIARIGHRRDEDSARLFVDLLADQGLVDELRTRADKKDEYAQRRLAAVLAERSLVEELRKRAARRDPYAARELVNVLAARGDTGGLRKLAAKRDGYAGDRLAALLAERGCVDELWEWVRSRGREVNRKMVDLLADHGRQDKLEELAREGDWYASRRLTDLLVEQGNVEIATAVLRHQADLGNGRAAGELAHLLAELGRIDEATAVLQPLADDGDPGAIWQISALRD
jgi:hypothetical protein